MSMFVHLALFGFSYSEKPDIAVVVVEQFVLEWLRDLSCLEVEMTAVTPCHVVPP